MALRGLDRNAIVSFYGNLTRQNPAMHPGQIKAEELACSGVSNLFTRPEKTEALKQEMKNAKVDLTFKRYLGAKYAF